MKSWQDNPNVSAYLDGLATEDVRQEVEAATAADPALRQFLNGWPAVTSAFASLPKYRLPEDFADQVFAAIEARKSDLVANETRIAAAAKVFKQAESRNGSTPTVDSHVVASPIPTRRSHAASWLAIAAAASLMFTILASPGLFSRGDTPGEFAQSTVNDSRPSDRSHDALRQAELGTVELGRPAEIESAIEGAASDEEKSKDVDLAKPAVGSGWHAEELAGASAGPATNEDLRRKEEDAEQELDRRPSDVEIQEQHKQAATLVESDASEDAVAFYGMLYRLQEQLSRPAGDSTAAVLGYLAEIPPPQGVDVVVCDLIVPPGVSESDLVIAFEQTLAMQQDEFAALAEARKFGRMAETEGIQSLQLAQTQTGARQDDFGANLADALQDSAAEEKATKELLAKKLSGKLDVAPQSEEVYYVESSREQIDAAIESVAIKISGDILVRNVVQPDEMYSQLALFSQTRDRGLAELRSNQTATEGSLDAEKNSVAAGFGGAGGEGAGRGGGGNQAQQNTGVGANNGLGVGDGANLASDASNSSVDKTTEAERQPNDQPQQPPRRGLAIRLPASAYGGAIPIAGLPPNPVGNTASAQDDADDSSALGGTAANDQTDQDQTDQQDQQAVGGRRRSAGGGQGRGGASRGGGGVDQDGPADGRQNRFRGAQMRNNAGTGPDSGGQAPPASEQQQSDEGRPQAQPKFEVRQRILQAQLRRAFVVFRIHREDPAEQPTESGTSTPPTSDDGK